MTVPFSAQFFDGHSAATHNAEVRFSASGLQIILPHQPDKVRNWPFAGLRAIDRPHDGQPMRLTHEKENTARLIVPVGQAQRYIVQRSEHLYGAPMGRKLAKYAAIGVMGLGLAVVAGYAVLNLAPNVVAGWMSDDWRDRLGEQTEAMFIDGVEKCNDAAGKVALARLASRVAQSGENAPEFSVRVFDLPMVNAFALPGGRIVITGKLIDQAGSPEEVAGVVAHELGHVAHRHPEAQLVRMLGLQMLVAVMTGGNSGDALASIATMLTILRYTRSAEREADNFALEVLEAGDIDPKGLRSFFEKLSKTSGGSSDSRFGSFGDMLSTHPGTDERIETFKPFPEGRGREVLDAAEWRALKAICKT